MDNSIDDREVQTLERLTSEGLRDDAELCDGKAQDVIASAARPPTERQSKLMKIAVIDGRALPRECFARSIEAEHQGLAVSCFSSVAEWHGSAIRHTGTSLVLLCTGGRRVSTIAREIEALVERGGAPVILLSDEQQPEDIQQAIELGVRGFIPTSVDLHLAVQAMQLVRAGGIYLPESILGSQKTPPLRKNGRDNGQSHGLFTARQAAVVDALRQGKPNKIIAYELEMRESTVKVHIRNIMRKLNARNRTEVAFMVTKIANGEPVANGRQADLP